jgi:hypothetical protein
MPVSVPVPAFTSRSTRPTGGFAVPRKLAAQDAVVRPGYRSPPCRSGHRSHREANRPSPFDRLGLRPLLHYQMPPSDTHKQRLTMNPRGSSPHCRCPASRHVHRPRIRRCRCPPRGRIIPTRHPLCLVEECNLPSVPDSFIPLASSSSKSSSVRCQDCIRPAHTSNRAIPTCFSSGSSNTASNRQSAPASSSHSLLP